MNTNSWVFSSWKGSTRWYMQGDRYRREIRPPLSSHKHSFLPGTKYTAIVGTTKVHHVSRIVLSRTRNGQLFFSWIDLCTRTYSTSKVGPKKSLRHFGRDYPNTYSFVVTYRKKKKKKGLSPSDLIEESHPESVAKRTYAHETTRCWLITKLQNGSSGVHSTPVDVFGRCCRGFPVAEPRTRHKHKPPSIKGGQATNKQNKGSLRTFYE